MPNLFLAWVLILMFFNKKAGLIALCVMILQQSLWAFTPIKIVAITEDFASIATSIGGEFVEVTPLIKGSRNLHHINPKPSMVLKLKQADLLIRLGMQQDSWIDSLIQVARNNALFPGNQGYLDASEGIPKLEVPSEHIDGQTGDVHAEGNPHYWLNPNNGKIIAQQITSKLCLLDPEHTEHYTQAYAKFVKELDEKIINWHLKLRPLKDVQFITYHKIWTYFFDAFELHSIGELEPHPGIPPTTKHLYTLKQKVKDTPTLVLTASYYPSRVGKRFSDTINGPFYSLPCNVGEHGVQSYMGLFDHIIEELVQ